MAVYIPFLEPFMILEWGEGYFLKWHLSSAIDIYRRHCDWANSWKKGILELSSCLCHWSILWPSASLFTFQLNKDNDIEFCEVLLCISNHVLRWWILFSPSGIHQFNSLLVLLLPLKLNQILQEYAITWDFQEKKVSFLVSSFFSKKNPNPEQIEKDTSEKNEY